MCRPTYISESGNKEAREETARFLLRHRSECSHFNIFEHWVHCYARVVHRVLSASCVVSMQRRIYLGESISVPCATDRSIGLPELRHYKRHYQTDPDVKFRKPDCCCPAPDGPKHVELRKTGVNEGSLSGACLSGHPEEIVMCKFIKILNTNQQSCRHCIVHQNKNFVIKITSKDIEIKTHF